MKSFFDDRYDNRETTYDIRRNEKRVYKMLADLECAQCAFSCAYQIIVIGIAAIVPHNAMADSLMDEISQFVEENAECEMLDEGRKIR